MAEMGKAMVGYLDATTDSGEHARLVQLIDSLDTISGLFSVGTVTGLHLANALK